MKEKKEIRINRKSTLLIIKVFIFSLVLTFGLEHFGSFSSTVLGTIYDSSASYGVVYDSRLETRTFNTFLGNKIRKNRYSENVRAYRTTSAGVMTAKPDYIESLKYYFEAVLEDIMLPFIISIILISIYFFKEKFKIKFSEDN